MSEFNFGNIKTAHLIGIGGIGISAIARMFLLEGPSTPLGVKKTVSGSDVAKSEVTEELRKLGVKISIGQRADNIPADCDLVIYTIAVTPENPEFAEAKRRGIWMISYPEALGIISKEKYTIAIAGTHGKTTTTAMIAKIMMDAGLDPTVILGSFLLPSADLTQTSRRLSQKNTKTNFVGGKSKYFVVEACEYRRSFLNLSPKILVITNIDNDHLDYYKNSADIDAAFSELAAKVPPDGFIVCSPAEPRVAQVVAASQATVLDYNTLENFAPRLKVPGRHNLANARVANTACALLSVEKSSIIQSLEHFSGTWRRFECRGKTKNGALVYDDYGHHPREIEATLQGARELFPKKKIIVVFQPHLYSRTKDHLAAFGKFFMEADEVVVLPIYPAREKDMGDISSEMVVAEIKKNGQHAHFAGTFKEAAKQSVLLAGAAGVIFTMGAGETNKVADILVVSSLEN